MTTHPNLLTAGESLEGAVARPFRHRQLADGVFVAVSDSGDFAFLDDSELIALRNHSNTLPRERIAELKSKFFLMSPTSGGVRRLLASRVAARQETVFSGPSLHIFVTTLKCAHTCRYCQVSRSLSDDGFTMSIQMVSDACDAVFQSPAPAITVEFQGGDPLLRFDLVRFAIERITELNRNENRQLRFVIASTLHQLDAEMCAFLKSNRVYLSTSIDGPQSLHDKNRPVPGRDSYARTVSGIHMARSLISPDSVAALMTASRESLACPEDIVDAYVGLELNEIFLRPLSRHGFARRNASSLGYAMEDFHAFYDRAFERILDWNRKGVPIREVGACIVFNKLLCSFDGGYVDLQSPTGAGLAVLVYNYDGYVYPSDEARMLAAAGDTTLRLGRIGDPLDTMLTGAVQQRLLDASWSTSVPGCRDCAYNRYCGPDPVSSYNEFGSCEAPVHLTDHCKRHLWLFDYLLTRLRQGDPWFEDLAFQWAQPANPVPSTYA